MNGMAMPKSLLFWCFFCLLCNLTFSKKIEEIFTCVNDTDCEELVETYTDTTLKDETTSMEFSSTTVRDTTTTDIINSTTSASTSVEPVSSTTSIPPRGIHYDEMRNHSVHKVWSDVCDCNLRMFSCDINCCCDTDCNDFHLTAFSHCEDHHPELYDSRYCYHRNFIDRNNTPFILEKLASNLFCILYDNLPPTYSISDDLVLKDGTDLNNAIDPKTPMWKWENREDGLKHNISSTFQSGDTVWGLYQNYIKPVEFLQSGFTESCAFRKTLKYLHEWKGSCLQTNLKNTNTYLFPSTYNNFSVISSSHLLNDTPTVLSLSQDCSKNICLPIISHYCRSSWTICNASMLPTICFDDVCMNIVTGVRYLIVHNGSMGISSVDAYFRLENISSAFYQDFEVVYDWAGIKTEETLMLSGNPGYILEKPIVIGTLVINKTEKSEIQYIAFNKNNSFLTLPVAEKNGRCSTIDRHVVAFGENVKLKCKVFLETTNFTSMTCIELQNRTMQFLMSNTLFNVSNVNQYPIYVSKTGNFTKNDTASWAQIFLNRIPQSVVSGQVINGGLHCSGLVTSVHFQILYFTVPKPETLTNYNILGVGVQFSDETDISWVKCTGNNCTDTLVVDSASYVTFHDVSKPSKYYFVGAPNLDITLPYDFFYPFLSRSPRINSNTIIVSILAVSLLHIEKWYL